MERKRGLEKKCELQRNREMWTVNIHMSSEYIYKTMIIVYWD